jgi:DNA-binding winged helix-turn-helix (wHTH) protein
MAWRRAHSLKEFQRIYQRSDGPVRARFEAFTVDSDARLLWRDRQEIHLSPKAFDLLCLLIARRPNVVAKADIFGRIWPDTFVLDANLNVLVGEVRRALGDSVQAPRFIRTAHGVGYAFCGKAVDIKETMPSGGAAGRFRLEAGSRTYELGEGEHTIGRDPRSTIHLDDASVSRRHARIRVTSAGGALLADLESTNGTFVRGRRIKTERALSDGDTVTIGSVPLIFREGPETLPVTKRVRRGAR